MFEASDTGHRLVCLLSVRNGAYELPDYLDSAANFADAVVALDDGSTDGTSDILKRHPLVKVQLSNRAGEIHSGGIESEIRNRLLQATVALQPCWILSLNADERISVDDAAALRAFLRDEAIRGAAYGFCMHRKAVACDRHGDDGEWHFRLFSYRHGQRFPGVTSRFSLVPNDIPREHWIRTTLRIHQQGRMAGLARPPNAGVVIPSGGKEPPVCRAELQRCFDQRLDPDRPVLSAIVISQNDRDRIEEVVDSLVAQKVDRPVEFILVNSGLDGTAEFVREHYSQVRVVHLPDPALPGRARNAGLDIATGDFIAFSGSHIVLPPGTLQRRVEAHESGYAMVCGTVLNGTYTRAGWASYFMDHAVALSGRPSGVLRVAPSRCSYMRGPLTAIGGFPEDRRVGEDTVVNSRLFDLGYRAYHSRDVQCIHKSPCRTAIQLLEHHFERGLGFGKILWEQAGQPQGLSWRCATILWLMTKYPVRRARFIMEAVHDWGTSVRRKFVLSLPLILAGVASAAVGAILFLLRPHPAAPTAVPVRGEGASRST